MALLAHIDPLGRFRGHSLGALGRMSRIGTISLLARACDGLFRRRLHRRRPSVALPARQHRPSIYFSLADAFGNSALEHPEARRQNVPAPASSIHVDSSEAKHHRRLRCRIQHVHRVHLCRRDDPPIRLNGVLWTDCRNVIRRCDDARARPHPFHLEKRNSPSSSLRHG